MPHLSDAERTPPELTPLWQSIIRRAPQPAFFAFEIDRSVYTPEQLREIDLDNARHELAEARAALAAACRAQDPDRHFRGLPESAEVIAAYDVLREAEAAVARLERQGRTP